MEYLVGIIVMVLARHISDTYLSGAIAGMMTVHILYIVELIRKEKK